MNPRKLINFIKSPSGRMVGFFLALILSIALIGYFTGGPGDRKPSAKAPNRPLTQPVTPPEQTVSYTQERPFQPAQTSYAPSRRREQAGRPDTLPEPTASGERRHTEVPLGIQVYAEAVTPAPVVPEGVPVQTVSPNERWAETGRYLWCELSFAVQNSPFITPITGRVLKPLIWPPGSGRVIIPEGTEVLGKALFERYNDKVGAQPEWTLVMPPFEGFPHGASLVVRALLCERVRNPKVDAPPYPKTKEEIDEDGGPGLRGKLCSATSTKEEIQFFAANVFVGAMNGITPQQQTVFGTQIVPGAKAALYQAIGTSAERYADRIFEIIRKEGFYVLVPPGKTFYLYVDQPILLREAKVGSTLAFHPTAVYENELRRRGFTPSEETPQTPREQQAPPGEGYGYPQASPTPRRSQLSPPIPQLPSDFDGSNLEPAQAANKTTH
jgi:hypothetical protein